MFFFSQLVLSSFPNAYYNHMPGSIWYCGIDIEECTQRAQHSAGAKARRCCSLRVSHSSICWCSWCSQDLCMLTKGVQVKSLHQFIVESVHLISDNICLLNCMAPFRFYSYWIVESVHLDTREVLSKWWDKTNITMLCASRWSLVSLSRWSWFELITSFSDLFLVTKFMYDLNIVRPV